jgi:hypothetical protein
MNHITRLQLDKSDLEFNASQARIAIHDLFAYVNSGKFSCGNELDGYVNVDDVRRYLLNALDKLNGIHT